MLNKEKNASEIVEIAIEGGSVGMVNGKLVPCGEIECPECDWFKFDCYEELKKWANSEYIEPPKLTSEERRFCEYIKTGYIVRDKSDECYWHKEKPNKYSDEWYCYGNVLRLECLPGIPQFEFIKWTDEGPWAVEDLLKLEVTE